MKALKKFQKLTFALACVNFANQVWAQDLTGYFAPTAMVQANVSPDDKSGTRGGALIEFTRIPKWISAEFRFLSGMSYTDFGAAIRLHTYLETENGNYYLLGAGPGFAILPQGTDGKSSQVNDFFISTGITYVNVIDQEWGWHMRIGSDFRIKRHVTGSQEDNGQLKVRPFFALGILFGA